MKQRWITSGVMMVLLLGAGAQAATSIVDFAHAVGTVNIDAADNVTSNGHIWTFSDSGTPLLQAGTSAANTSGTIYGGLNITWDDPTNYTPNIQLNGNSDAFYIQNNAQTSKQRNRGLLVWNRADFLNHSTNDYVVFDTESSMSVDVPLEGGTTRVRFLVNDGGDYYVSSNVLSNVGTLTLNDPGATHWAPVATEGSYAIGAYTNQTFHDIQGVGLYIDQSTVNQARIEVSGFQASATTTTNVPPEKPVDLPIIDFTHITGTGNARTADNVTSNGNTWIFSDSTVLVSNSEGAGESNTQIYGGLQTFWETPTNHNPVFALRADPGRLQTQVNPLTDGNKGNEGILVWNKADFLNHSNTTVVFSAESSMSLTTTQKAGTTVLRFVVNDGGSYYVSRTTTNNIGTLTLDNPRADSWAPISTNDYSIGAYTNQNFTDILGVGIYVKQSRTGTGQTIFKLDDFQVVAARAIPPSDDPYENWINKYYLAGDDAALDADIENGGLGDGMDNLLEYAIGGNPNIDDAASVQPAGFAGDTGTWFYYVYGAREDDQTLSYTVYVDNDLVADPSWSTNGISFVGESGLDSDGYKTVTNRTDMGNAEFIKLQVERTK